MNFQDIMVDIETSGLDPSRSHMLQLAAVRFNADEGTVDSDMFNASILPDAWGRAWDEGTRRWWSDKPAVLNKIMAEGRPAAVVIPEYQRWVNAKMAAGPYRFWSKPLSFDWPFVASYIAQFGTLQANPFDFREAVDMRTWCRARMRTFDSSKIYEVEKSIPFQGAEHNALFDTLHQCKIVLKVAEMTK